MFWDTLYVLRLTRNLTSETVGQFPFDLRSVVTYFCQFYQNGNQKWGLKLSNCPGTPCTCLDSTSETVVPFCFDLCSVVTWFFQFHQNGNQNWGFKNKKLSSDTLYISVMTVVEIHSEAGKIQKIFESQWKFLMFFLYFVSSFDWRLWKKVIFSFQCNFFKVWGQFQLSEIWFLIRILTYDNNFVYFIYSL